MGDPYLYGKDTEKADRTPFNISVDNGFMYGHLIQAQANFRNSAGTSHVLDIGGYAEHCVYI